MLKAGAFVVLAVVLQVVSSQHPPPAFLANLPAECQKPPRARPHECCEIPPFIDESKLAACGIEKPKDGELPHPKTGPPDCSMGLCLLKNHNLLDDDNKIKTKEILAFMDVWVQANPEFEKAIETAKGECIKEGGPPGPPHICEADRFFFCMTGNVFMNCPKWKETDVCKDLQDHMNKCHKYFAKPPAEQQNN